MNEEIGYSLHDEIAELKSKLESINADYAMLGKAFGIISNINEDMQALVYDTLCDVGYYEHETEDEVA